MRLVHRIAPTGHFLEDVLLGHTESTDELGETVVTPDPVPADCVAEAPPAGLQWPRWDGVEWVDAGVPFTVDPETGVPIIPEE